MIFAERPDATATAPPELRGRSRDDVRLLVARPGRVEHARFTHLAEHLAPGDVLVVNDSATVPGQVDAELVGRGPVVLHVASTLDDGTRVVELRTAPVAARAVLDAAAGDTIRASGVTMRLVAPYPAASSPTGSGNRLWRAAVIGDLRRLLATEGRPISYGYLDRRYPLAAYQSIFSTVPGSAEMPTAARPFTHALADRVRRRGVTIAPITLHTGVSSQEAGEAPQDERYAVPAATAALVNATLDRGGRVVAVGTSVTRALESAVRDGRVVATDGWTDRVITPAAPPQVVGGLVTGWHDPGASHLLLVEAVAGAELAQAAYDAAVTEGYLWHEFGDSALLLP
ncbi:S-adenosylmethionine:tRNA ribosyltransferase-isomerase [Nocardioides ultimimeridianus]